MENFVLILPLSLLIFSLLIIGVVGVTTMVLQGRAQYNKSIPTYLNGKEGRSFEIKIRDDVVRITFRVPPRHIIADEVVNRLDHRFPEIDWIQIRSLMDAKPEEKRYYGKKRNIEVTVSRDLLNYPILEFDPPSLRCPWFAKWGKYRNLIKFKKDMITLTHQIVVNSWEKDVPENISTIDKFNNVTKSFQSAKLFPEGMRKDISDALNKLLDLLEEANENPTTYMHIQNVRQIHNIHLDKCAAMLAVYEQMPDCTEKEEVGATIIHIVGLLSDHLVSFTQSQNKIMAESVKKEARDIENMLSTTSLLISE